MTSKQFDKNKTESFKFISWLAQQPGSPKHQGWLHPLSTFTLHYLIVIYTSIWLHDRIIHPLLSQHKLESNYNVEVETPLPTSIQIHISNIVLSYACILFLLRIITEPAIARRIVLYELTWMCNTTLIIGAIGIRTCRPLLTTSTCIAVSIDHVMWYIDLPSWFLFGTFPIGVAKYLTWESKHWSTKWTCTHHLWTLPLFLYASDGLQCASYPMSIYLMVIQVLLSSWMIPPSILLQLPTSHKQPPSVVSIHKYLNINLSHELWKDVTFPFLQISYDTPTKCIYLVRLFWKWSFLNFIVFSFLYCICFLFF